MKRLTIFERVAVAIIATALSAFLALGPAGADAPKFSDAFAVRSTIQNLNVFLDSQYYAEMASWDEHVVSVYRLAADRDPNLLEFFQLRKTTNERR